MNNKLYKYLKYKSKYLNLIGGNNHLILPNIDKYFNDNFYDQKNEKYNQSGRRYTPEYMINKLGRNKDNLDNQYLHYYLQKKYNDSLNVYFLKFYTTDISKVSDVISSLDFSKINMIPIRYESPYNPHISLLIINPFIKSIEYYNTLCGIGNLKDIIYNELHKYLPDYSIYGSSELYFQTTDGPDMLCEFWICFITECRILNKTLNHINFNLNMKNIFEFYLTLYEQKKDLEQYIEDNPKKKKNRDYKKMMKKTYWYSEIISSYALYFEYEIINLV